MNPPLSRTLPAVCEDLAACNAHMNVISDYYFALFDPQLHGFSH